MRRIQPALKIQRQHLPTFALAPADIRRTLKVRHRVVKINGCLVNHGTNRVHIRPVRQQRYGHHPRTGALETMQRDRIAGALCEHGRVLADKRLADEVDALLAAVDDQNVLIHSCDTARSQMLPQRLRERGRTARRRIAQERPRPLLRQLIGQRDKLPCLLLRCQRCAGGKIIDGPGLRLPCLKTVEHHAVCKKLKVIQRRKSYHIL